MAIRYRPYPTMTDLRASRALEGPGDLIAKLWPSEWAEEKPLLATLDARQVGYDVPGLPRNATVEEAIVFKWLLDLDLIGMHLARSYQSMIEQLGRNKVLSCLAINRYNTLAKEYVRLQAKALVMMAAAGVTSLPPRPAVPPVFRGVGLNAPGEDGLVPCTDPAGLVGPAGFASASGVRIAVCDGTRESDGQLGLAPAILWGAAGLAMALGVGGYLLFRGMNLSTVKEEEEATERTRTFAEALDKEQALALALAKQCKTDECIKTVAAASERNLKVLRSTFEKLLPTGRHSAFWWAGLIGLVGLAGAGVYAYRTRRRGGSYDAEG